jgi:hypothetical protein
VEASAVHNTGRSTLLFTLAVVGTLSLVASPAFAAPRFSRRLAEAKARATLAMMRMRDPATRAAYRKQASTQGIGPLSRTFVREAGKWGAGNAIIVGGFLFHGKGMGGLVTGLSVVTGLAYKDWSQARPFQAIYRLSSARGAVRKQTVTVLDASARGLTTSERRTFTRASWLTPRASPRG